MSNAELCSTVTVVHLLISMQAARVYFHQLGRWHICPTMREGHINLWGKVEEKVPRESSISACGKIVFRITGLMDSQHPCSGLGNLYGSVSAPCCRKTLGFWVFTRAESLTSDAVVCMCVSGKNRPVGSKKKSAFGMICWVVMQWIVFSCAGV